LEEIKKDYLSNELISYIINKLENKFNIKLPEFYKYYEKENMYENLNSIENYLINKLNQN